MYLFIYSSEIARAELISKRQGKYFAQHLWDCHLVWSDILQVQTFFLSNIWKHLWILVFKDVKTHFHLKCFTFQVLALYLK